MLTFWGIYKLAAYNNTKQINNIWLEHHPAPSKGTTVRIMGKEKEEKVSSFACPNSVFIRIHQDKTTSFREE